jgi:hypothetical protein
VAKKTIGRASPRILERLSDETFQLGDEIDVTDRVVAGDFSGSEVSHTEFHGCRIGRAQLTGSTLRRCRFVD